MTMILKGREVWNNLSDQAVEKMNKIFLRLAPVASLENVPVANGRNIVMILSPKKKN